jgi:hemerythrin-like domain-containing protein
MLRDKSLVPLSRQHQHALALCVRIDRASPIKDADLAGWHSEITQHFQTEIGIHFAAEEQVLFPLARKLPDLISLVEELSSDHAALRESFAQAEAGQMSAADLSAFVLRMSSHIRKEERQLFERMQELMSQEELALLGQRLDNALKDAAQACTLPADAMRPHGKE